MVWGRVEIAVRKGDLAPLSQLYYDEDGKQVRRQEFSDFKLLDGQVRPMKMLMRPLGEGSGDEFTELIIKDLQLNIPIDVGFFSLLKLKSG